MLKCTSFSQGYLNSSYLLQVSVYNPQRYAQHRKTIQDTRNEQQERKLYT